MKNYKLKVFTFSLFLSSSYVFADQSNFNRSRVSHTWNSSQLTSGYDIKSGLGVDYRSLFSIQFDQVAAPYKLVDQNGNLLTEVVDSFSRLRLGFGYHINREWFFGVSVPFDSVKSKPFTNNSPHPNIITDGFTQTYSGIGDIELTLRKRLESLSLRWNWVLETSASLPTGDEDSFNTDGDFSIGVRMAFNKYYGRENQFSTYGYLGAKYSPGSRLEIDPVYQSFEAEKRLEFGVGIRNQTTSELGLFSDFSGFLSFPFDDGQNPIELSLGADYTFGSDKLYKVYAGLGLEGVSGEEFSNDSRFFLGLKKQIGKLSPALKEKFSKSKYPVYSSSYDVLLDSVTSETSVIKKMVGKAKSAFFVSGSSNLSREGKHQIIDIASHLIKHRDHVTKVKVVGYTDSTGNSKDNIILSKKRAEQVKKALVDYGVKPEIFKVVSIGKSSRKEADDFGKLGNRRAEIFIDELQIDYINFPNIDEEEIVYHENFWKKSELSAVASESFIKDEMFPRPFKVNNQLVSKFSIITEDNQTWGSISEKAYGTRKFKEVLRNLNYNRQPALGDIVYFFNLKDKEAYFFEYFKW